MEARVASESHQFYTAGTSSLNGIAKKSFEWDLNDWKWDGELFLASPLNSSSAGCRNKQLLQDAANRLPSNSSSSCSEEVDFGLVDREKGEAEKRRRTLVVEENAPYDDSGSLSLKLGGHAFPVKEAEVANWAEKNGKKGKSQGSSSNPPTCQVEGCRVDLTDSKDYHRRHKVCEMHAKASTAMVGNAIQRFCQQCSRFHLLQEFDEGKRSCRRRLAGHNRRRRKTHPDVPVSGNPIDEQASSYILISLLRILSNLQSDNSELSKDQELLAHFLRSIASLAGSLDPTNLTQLIKSSQDPANIVTVTGPSSGVANASVSNGVPVHVSARSSSSTPKVNHITDIQCTLKPTDHSVSAAARTVDMTSKETADSPESGKEIVRMRDFDLNDMYIDTQDSMEGLEKPANPTSTTNGFPNSPSWLQDSHQLSPPKISGNSDSASGQSLSSCNRVSQCRTDRIVFKLFGKDPNDFPLVLKAQILDWLSCSPTDIESYIRPGCVILTLYLRLSKTAWKELCHDMNFKMNRLLCNSTDDFWTKGWIYARIQNHIAFIYNGKFLLDIPLPIRSSDHHTILCVTPIAVPHSSMSTFTVKGLNLARQSSRLLCLFEGRYLVQETTQAIAGEENGSKCLKFSCSLPCATGRGFIEVEDYGLSNTFFPFLVAEEDVCSEVCMLENAIDVVPCDDQLWEGTDADYARSEALEFIHEFGWILRRDCMRSRSGELNYFHSLARFRWLMSFAMNREWSAVIKKLLDILFDGKIDLGAQSAVEFASSEGLLHNAVRRNSRTVVELLLRYMPVKSPKETLPVGFLFRPDMLGPSNITPLHVAASTSGAESVLDALTDDPGLLGVKAWKNLRDCTGFTAEDYAHAQGHKSYISLVQKKIDKQHGEGQVVVNIAGDASPKVTDGTKSSKLTSFEINKGIPRMKQPADCKWCAQHLAYQNSAVARTLLYRPAMLCMVGIAAVCVCVGLLLKTPPEVFYVNPSFRWELLEFGFI